ncbi:MAG: phage holin family protein [Prolixibacteraceae bacterium]|nr:phage holin family protein [Prolixibacteraceae bacterium]
MKENITDSFQKLKDTATDYAKLQLKLFKLCVIQKIDEISVLIISSFVFILIGFIFLLFISAVFVVWYGTTFGNYLTALLIIIGFIILLFLIFYVKGRKWISSAIMKKLSSIISEDEENLLIKNKKDK